MPRIAVGGIQHETNTFDSVPATFTDFEAPDAWPGLVRGAELFDAVRGINLPAAGFIDEARASGCHLVPLAWCSAQPSGRVTRDAFERVCGMLLDDLSSCTSLDAVYLDLHGAMVAEHVLLVLLVDLLEFLHHGIEPVGNSAELVIPLRGDPVGAVA